MSLDKVIDREWKRKRKKNESVSLAEYTARRQILEERPPIPEKMKSFIEKERDDYYSERNEPREEKSEEVEEEDVEPSVLERIEEDLAKIRKYVWASMVISQEAIEKADYIIDHSDFAYREKSKIRGRRNRANKLRKEMGLAGRYPRHPEKIVSQRKSLR